MLFCACIYTKDPFSAKGIPFLFIDRSFVACVLLDNRGSHRQDLRRNLRSIVYVVGFSNHHYVYYAFVGSFLSAKTVDLVDMSFGYDFRTLVSVLT